jgi:hypothetical protein
VQILLISVDKSASLESKMQTSRQHHEAEISNYNAVSKQKDLEHDRRFTDVYASIGEKAMETIAVCQRLEGLVMEHDAAQYARISEMGEAVTAGERGVAESLLETERRLVDSATAESVAATKAHDALAFECKQQLRAIDRKVDHNGADGATAHEDARRAHAELERRQGQAIADLDLRLNTKARPRGLDSHATPAAMLRSSCCRATAVVAPDRCAHAAQVNDIDERQAANHKTVVADLRSAEAAAADHRRESERLAGRHEQHVVEMTKTNERHIAALEEQARSFGSQVRHGGAPPSTCNLSTTSRSILFGDAHLSSAAAASHHSECRLSKAVSVCVSAGEHDGRGRRAPDDRVRRPARGPAAAGGGHRDGPLSRAKESKSFSRRFSIGASANLRDTEPAPPPVHRHPLSPPWPSTIEPRTTRTGGGGPPGGGGQVGLPGGRVRHAAVRQHTRTPATWPCSPRASWWLSAG